MSKSNTCRVAKPRTTLPLTGTVRRLEAHLSSDAELALLYAATWLQRAGRIKVPAAGIIRAALLAYAGRLQGMGEAEAFAEVRRACSAFLPDPEERQLAELRLYGPASEPLPGFQAVLHGPNRAREVAKMIAGAEALTELALVELAQRPRRREAAPTAAS